MCAMPPTERLAEYTAQQLASVRSLDFVRYVSCLLAEENHPYAAAKHFEMRWPRSLHLDLIQKSAVPAGTTSDAVWAGNLAPLKPLTDAFLALVRPLTILGRVRGLRSVPFNISIPAQTGGGTYGWVGHGAPTPVGKLAFSDGHAGHHEMRRHHRPDRGSAAPVHTVR